MNRKILKYWKQDNNPGININEYKDFSNKRMIWECSLNHKWGAPISRISGNDGCPICSNRKLLKGYNDFMTRYPEVAAEWSFNNNIRPDSFMMNGSKKYLWRCPLNHEYQSTTRYRAERRQGCPYCVNRKIMPGFNDLEFLFPEVAKEWNYEKNYKKPNEVSAYLFTKVWWRCSAGHEWESPIINRTHHGTGCKICSGSYSQEEKHVLKFIKNIYNGIIIENDRTILKPKELDMYLPKLKIAFEYNGELWHDRKSYEKDLKNNTVTSRERFKELECQKLGITLYHIWSSDWRSDRSKSKKDIESIINSHMKK